jgi:hypothetical protein
MEQGLDVGVVRAMPGAGDDDDDIALGQVAE